MKQQDLDTSLNLETQSVLKDKNVSKSASSCPFKSSCPVQSHGHGHGHGHGHDHDTPLTNQQRWPNQLDLRSLYINNPMNSPMDNNFNYINEFNSLNLAAVKSDLALLMTDSQSWWPADFGNYGPFFIRMAWHSAGTYRIGDGRGGSGSGNIRFAPLNSWPDNGNLDKARRLLWPIKQKYGRKISWADLMILTGNVALETMGFATIGFGGGRIDAWEPDNYTYWGSETKMLDNDKRYSCDGQLEKPLGATHMGLIYVNPQGPNGNPDPIAAAHDIRETFGRMGMNDEETVALIAGGHTFGKCHGAASSKNVGPEPEAAHIHEMGLGWKNHFGTGKGADTITSGLEVTWTDTPTVWSNYYFESLFENEWELIKSPAGAHQWEAVHTDTDIPDIPDAFDPLKKHFPRMLTTDLSLRFDPSYVIISRNFLNNPAHFATAFAKAWFKLTHRDMGPRWRYLGPYIPTEDFIWQDPTPVVNHPLVTVTDINNLKTQISNSGLTVSELVYTAWSSASTYRNSDKRGGSNGARIRLLPQKFWAVNQPEQLSKVLLILETIQSNFNNAQTNGKKISIADLIVLGGNVGIEQAAQAAGNSITVPFTPGRMDASQEQTDINSFNVLEPLSDGFRNYHRDNLSTDSEKLLIDKAQLLSLTAPQLTVLVGGLRCIGVNFDNSIAGVLTSRTGALTTDYFINILDINTIWKQKRKNRNMFKGVDRNTGITKWKATRCDLIFGSNAVLRASCEVYASYDASNKFVNDFVEVWNKVMNAGCAPQV
uniref:Catalase-peroxidase n=1 Tax=viral metagenome TaxID=1070528 RepID=A0A6C0EWN6_9ZZZZ